MLFALTLRFLKLLDITLAKGKYFCRIGEWSSAVTEFDAIIKKEKAGSGRKIDAHFEKAKIALFNKVIIGFKNPVFGKLKLQATDSSWNAPAGYLGIEGNIS